MKMTLTQTKLVGLTMQLDLKAQEFHQLQKQLQAYQAQGLAPNDPAYAQLLTALQANQAAIVQLKQQLAALQ